MLANAEAAEVSIEAEPAPEYDALFARADGWIGADGDYSVALDKNTALWLFSDTFVGRVKDNRRVDTVMINNSVAIQHIGSSKPIEFFYPKTKDGAPASFITPDDGRGYFWPFDAVMTSKGLFMFLTRVEHSDASPVFPFKLFGSSLGHVEDPSLQVSIPSLQVSIPGGMGEKPSGSPLEWKITQRNVPFTRFAKDQTIFFGSAALEVGSHIYVYGLDSRRKAESGERKSAPSLPVSIPGGMGTPANARGRAVRRERRSR